ncbi:MAG: hypothetical protein K9G48_08545 [Reyranella sp.]|nr:hypothetical protein [Reyranella sp.]
MREVFGLLAPKVLFPPKVAGTDNTPIVSEIIDVRNSRGCLLTLILGVNTDTNATFAVLLEESDDAAMGGANEVADSDLLGTEALAAFTAANDDGKCKKLGYAGRKGYIRATVTPSGNDSGNIYLAGLAQVMPKTVPTANPPN